MPAVLAVDLGKTRCRAALWSDRSAQPIAEADGPGSPGLAAPGGVAAAGDAIAWVAERILTAAGHPAVAVVCVGAAGALAAPDAARALAGRLPALIPTGEVVVCSDALAAHAGALGGRAGLVLAAGTGAVVIAVGAGRLVRVDGWGPLLGDAGSGGWIGTEGLRAALRAFDGRGPGTDLMRSATAEFGDLGLLPSVLGREPNPTRAVAAFAPGVAEAAASGDQVAADIMRAAAAALADSVVAAAAQLRLTDPDLAIVGGLVGLGAILLDPLLARVRSRLPGLRLRQPNGSALDGARLLAEDPDTDVEPHLHRYFPAGRTGPSTAPHPT